MDALTQEKALEAARIIQKAAADLTKTICSIDDVILTDKQDGFWFQITIGEPPFKTYPDASGTHWAVEIDGRRETYYAHSIKAFIPQSALEPEPGVEREHHRLKAIGAAFGDVWWDNRYLSEIRKDWVYLIPYLERTIETDNP